MNYYQLTLEEREMLHFYLAQGFSISKTASLLNRNKSTISRELKRNSVNGNYLPCQAQQKYIERRKNVIHTKNWKLILNFTI